MDAISTDMLIGTILFVLSLGTMGFLIWRSMAIIKALSESEDPTARCFLKESPPDA